MRSIATVAILLGKIKYKNQDQNQPKRPQAWLNSKQTVDDDLVEVENEDR
jgi:hypothetical protein